MIQNKYIRLLSVFFMLILLNMGLTSCKEDEPNDSPFTEEKFQTTILVYAVATNTLSVNLEPDKNEMLLGAENIDLSKNKILVYQTTYKEDPQLIELVKTDDGYVFETVSIYSKDISALDPSRISEVIESVIDRYPSNNYGLIFWSHSSGSQPFMDALQPENAPAPASFGQDLTTEDVTTKSINIDLLASLIPDDVFKFIWFDSCYMGNIESIYEFRGKCKYYIGYATEVLDAGMPYDMVLPLITGKSPDPVKGAEAFFKYYEEYPYSSLRIATVAVVDMDEIERIADVCRDPYKNIGTVNYTNLMRYTRGSTGPFYELGDYVRSMTPEENLEEFNQKWEEALNACILYKAATPRDFSGNIIYPERYSGLSCHLYNPEDDSLKESYYKSLAWYKSVVGE